jgi:hypothetical protein
MSIHVVILQRRYVDLILAGRKTVESRLTRTAGPPFGKVEVGQRLFIKASGGPFMATAVAGAVAGYDNLTPDRIRQLYRQYNAAVCGEGDYWKLKRDSRYATFITLEQVEPLDVGPAYNRSLQAWHVLSDDLSPLVDVILTAGAISNRYVRLARVLRMPERGPDALWDFQTSFVLVMPDDEEVETQLTASGMIRWRGWGRYYDYYGMEAGDRVRFVSIGPRRYGVLLASVYQESDKRS